MGKSWLFVSLLALCAFGIERTELGGEFGNAMLTGSVGARAQGLGNAAAALNDQSANAFINPAAMAFNRRTKLQLGGSLLSLSRKEGYASYSHYLKPRGVFGIAWLYRGDPAVTGLRGTDEEIIGDGSEGINAFHMGFAYPKSKRLSFGASISAYFHSLRVPGGDFSVSGLGNLSTGIFYIPRKNLTLSLNFRNLPVLGSTLDWKVPSEYDYETVLQVVSPYNIQMGGAYRTAIAKIPVLLSLEENIYLWYNEPDTIKYWYYGNTHHAGIECQLGSRFFVRAGYDDNRFPFGLTITDISKELEMHGRFAADIHYCFAVERNGMGFNHSTELICRF